MAITLADQYYLKALEGYGYSAEETVENLNYALSYDDEHAGANHLMGRLYMEEFHKFDLAEEYFVHAMGVDPENAKLCYDYAWLMIRTQRYDDALKLIRYTLGLKGIIRAEVLRMKGLVYELKNDFDQSIEYLNQAVFESYDSKYIEFLEEELLRVENKKKRSKKVHYTMTW